MRCLHVSAGAHCVQPCSGGEPETTTVDPSIPSWRAAPDSADRRSKRAQTCPAVVRSTIRSGARATQPRPPATKTQSAHESHRDREIALERDAHRLRSARPWRDPSWCRRTPPIHQNAITARFSHRLEHIDTAIHESDHRIIRTHQLRHASVDLSLVSVSGARSSTSSTFPTPWRTASSCAAAMPTIPAPQITTSAFTNDHSAFRRYALAPMSTRIERHLP